MVSDLSIEWFCGRRTDSPGRHAAHPSAERRPRASVRRGSRPNSADFGGCRPLGILMFLFATTGPRRRRSHDPERDRGDDQIAPDLGDGDEDQEDGEGLAQDPGGDRQGIAEDRRTAE